MISKMAVSRPTLANIDASEFADFFKLLSDPTRVRVVFLLNTYGELHVQALCEYLGQTQPAVSHHLALLRNAELIELRREGKRNYYRLMSEHVRHYVDLLSAALPDDDDDERPSLFDKTAFLDRSALNSGRRSYNGKS